jgi:hypothetical protein
MNYLDEINALYNEIDEKVNGYYRVKLKKVPCENGCADCCNQSFEISMVEYIAILKEILKWDESRIKKMYIDAKNYMARLEKEYPTLYKLVMSLDESNMFDETKRYFNKERF